MITAVILAKNEEKNIEAAIESVSFCEEIIVVDNNSSDKTAEYSKNAGAKVLRSGSKNFSERRNLALQEARYDWILYVDADERVSEKLSKEIKSSVEKNEYDVYYICREDYFWGKPVRFGEVRQAYTKGIIRLVRKGSGKWCGAVHEIYVPDCQTGTLVNKIAHYSHEGIADFLDTINKYSSLRASDLKKKGTIFSGHGLVIFPIAKFVYTFFLLQGFRDGAAGFVYSFMMSFHSFLVRSKLYLLTHSQSER